MSNRMNSKVDSETHIKDRMSEILNQPRDALADDAELTSLVNSSFVLVEMIIDLQEELGVRFDRLPEPDAHDHPARFPARHRPQHSDLR